MEHLIGRDLAGELETRGPLPITLAFDVDARPGKLGSGEEYYMHFTHIDWFSRDASGNLRADRRGP